jgi:phage-related protein
MSTPASIRSRLGGVDGSIIDVYGGEYEFDNYTVKLYNNRGMNRGVSIRYGKNLTDIQQDQNCSNVATGIYPYWYLETDVGNVLIELPEKIVPAPGTYNFVKIRTLDLSSEFETQPTEEKLRSKTESYIKANNIGVPSVSLSVSFAQLEQSEEYKGLNLLERVSLFDTVNVEFPALNVSATAKAVKMVYDVIADRVKSVTLGSVRANIADTIAIQQQEIEKKPSKSFMQTAVESLTKTILGAKGGSVRFLDENGDGEPDTLYIADNPNPMQAVKVWRFNYEGWGASQNGYNGPFELGATLKDGIVADFITAGTLNANTVTIVNLLADSITAGKFLSKDGQTYFDLDKSELVSKNNYRSIRIKQGLIEFVNSNGVQTLSIAEAGIGTYLLFADDGAIFNDGDGLHLNVLDSDLNRNTPYKLVWKTINGEKMLVGE